ncbi:putative barnase/colicin E5 family endoribonuclease [Helicobacter suis]|uniref:putative barnase/colicin E5 family endoribonuclease n=1 Tax=Helicobacter suis TaxID=104628 RepID=UPI003872C5F3
MQRLINYDNQELRVGLTQGWKHEGKNYWIATAYKKPPRRSSTKSRLSLGLAPI